MTISRAVSVCCYHGCVCACRRYAVIYVIDRAYVGSVCGYMYTSVIWCIFTIYAWIIVNDIYSFIIIFFCLLCTTCYA